MATKTVYQSDPISGIYLFTTQANELALAPGLFNIPFGAYEEAPPAVPEGEVAQWNPTSSAWMAVEDHRGETFYLVRTGRRTRWAAAWRSMVSQRVTPVGEKCQPG